MKKQGPESGGGPGRRGYTIIEMLTVVLIIAILAGIAVPAYLYYRKKALYAEAKSGLAGIRKLELIYKASSETYTDDFNLIGFSVDGSSAYTFDIPWAGRENFSARATANLDRDPALDIWTIDAGGDIKHSSID